MPITDLTSTMALKPVSCYTKAASWVNATDKSITTLVNTVWLLNNQISVDSSFENPYPLDFTSNGITYAVFRPMHVPQGAELYYRDPNDNLTIVFDSYNGGWVDQTYRTIEITGGTNATNSTLIAWLKQNAQLWSAALKPAHYFIKKMGSGVTDLTGTTWQFNEVPTPPSESTWYSINFNFTFGGNSISGSAINLFTGGQVRYTTPPTRAVTRNWVYGYVWTISPPLFWGRVVFNESTMEYYTEYDDSVRTITITGGDDATNTDLITWLQANATLVSGGTVGTYLQPVVLLQKVEEELIETPTLITFTITPPNDSPVECQAEEGMTWYEWTNSEYNTAVFTLMGVDYSLTCAEIYHSVNCGSGGYLYWTVYNAAYQVQGLDTIIANHNYDLVHSYGGTNN